MKVIIVIIALIFSNLTQSGEALDSDTSILTELDCRAVSTLKDEGGNCRGKTIEERLSYCLEHGAGFSQTPAGGVYCTEGLIKILKKQIKAKNAASSK